MAKNVASNPISLTAKEKILLHLKEYWKYKDEAETPGDVTQKGIASGTGLALSHIPRTLKKMREDELVVESKRYVTGATRRYKTYFLTDAGVKLARTVLKEVGKRRMDTPNGPLLMKAILDDNQYKSPLSVILPFAEGTPEPPSVGNRMFVVGPVPEVDNFVNRAEELAAIEERIEGEFPKVLVVYGSQGYGTTTLTAKYLEGQRDKRSVIWVDLKSRPDHVLEELEKRIVEAGLESRIKEPADIVKLFDGQKVLIVFDGYFHLPDSTVDFFADLVDAARDSRTMKIIVTSREDTPVYNRFYNVLDLNDHTVAELHVKGLDIDAFRQMLGGEDIAEDAVRRLFMFSRGKPSTLKLIASGDRTALEKEGQFTPEEIKLMLHLKTLKD